MAEFKLNRFRYTWRGEWSAYTRYNPDDVVSYGGKVYVSLETHAAAPNFYNDLNFFNNDIPPLLVPKWELVADGISWLGNWQPNTFYNVGDIVKLGGTVYVAVTGHTSVSHEIDFPSQIANWSVQTNSQDWKIDWQADTYYKINDIVRYGGRVFRCNTSHQSGNTQNGLEASSAFWNVFSIADCWTGDWTTSYRYRANDLVKYGGRIYRCDVGHTSAASAAEGLEADLAKWSVIFDGIRHRGDWAAGNIYLLNDTVKYGSYLYKANAFHLSGSNIDFSYFDVYLPGQEFDSDWSNTQVYQPGDVVNYGGNLYYALDLSLGSTPSASTNWQLLFQGSRMLGDWSGIQNYRLGDVVRRGGNLYACLLDHTNQDPDFLDDNSTTNSTYWDLIIPGIRWRGVWQSGEFYYAGDTVVWVSSSYTCLDKHLSDSGNRPDDDSEAGSTLEGRYWAKITEGNKINVLKEVGDIRTFGDTGDGSTIGRKALPVGTEGRALTVAASGEVSWDLLQDTDKVYYVAEFGEDIPSAGTSPQNPWRTIRYATENITGYATIFVRTGVYDEILPIRVPAFVAIVGDELRSTEVRPSNTILDPVYIDMITEAVEYIQDIATYIIREIAVGDIILAQGTVLYGTVAQDFSGTAATTNEVLIVDSLINQFLARLVTQNPASFTGSPSLTTDPGRLAARAQITANKSFIKNEVSLYIENAYTDSTVINLPARWDSDLDRIIDSIIYDIGYVGNWKTIEAANYFLCASDYDVNKIQNMFLLRDGTGLRNMTFTGLSGTLSGLSTLEVTQRPTAGAYASLDPGWGPGDSSAWVGTKSPYVQNVTTFGDGCIGLKIDGDLHSGGNQTIVANDFTQILSDGIGVWANGTGRTEVVSVFTYYNHISYLCTNGGKIRGTNGNSSYGRFGAVSDGFNTTEVPITASVNNRYNDASVYQVLCDENNGLLKFFYSNAGVFYTTASGTITGSGQNSDVVFDEFRTGGTFEVRITDPGDSSAAGGSGYVFTTNASQGGDNTRIQLAGSDENLASNYRQMRVVLSSGTGTGQYGYIAEYDSVGKYAYIGLEDQPQVAVTTTSSSGNVLTTSSTAHLTVNDPIIFVGTKFGNIQDFTVYYVRTIVSGTQFTISATSGPGAVFNLVNGTGTMTLHCIGWEHLVEGTAIEPTLDNTTNYFIEPRVNFTSPGFSSSAMTLPASRQWTSIAAGSNNVVAVALDSNIAVYSNNNGSTWLNGTLPATALWTKVKYLNGRFMAFATAGQAAVSTTGTLWSSMAMPSTAEWRDAAYGEGKWVAVAAGGTKAAYSTDGTNWIAATLPEGADWNAVEYGKGKFVATALSDSSTGVAVAYSDNGITWTAGSIPQGSYSLAYGNNRFVALSGGYAGATEVSISFDGITWTESTIQAADWRAIKYAGGLFVAVANGSATMAISKDGKKWTYQNMTISAEYCDITYSTLASPARFLVIAGLVANSTIGRTVSTGRTTEARAVVVAGRISAINIWEPGSGYSSAPVLTINDPNNTSEVATSVRIGNGVVANPTIINKGTGFETSSTRVAISGDGYRDEYQIGTYLIVDALTRIPGPGDNVNISGINDYIYKLLTTEILSGSVGNYTARLGIAKDLNREESPEHGTQVTIRQEYSQVRLTGHDLLDIGLGTFFETNYPDTLNPNGTVVAPENEVIERGGGRVFYTSTDQDGNFRVGELFAVEQATGTVTLNAQFFELEGLEELRLGGVTVGGSGVVIREFSTDATFTADSNNIVPTQRAIKAFLNARVSGGGADAITGQITAGIVQIGPDLIQTTTGDELIFDAKVNFRGGVDGTFYAQVFFLSGGA